MTRLTWQFWWSCGVESSQLHPTFSGTVVDLPSGIYLNVLKTVLSGGDSSAVRDELRLA